MRRNSYFADRRITCPFCFEEYPLSDLLFRCQTGRRCKGDAPEFPAPTKNGRKLAVREATCPGCLRTSKVRHCPHCQSQMPPNFGECQSLTIGLVGSKYTGKSHFVGVLVDRIKRSLAVPQSPWGCSFMFLGDSSRNRYRNDFYRWIFEQKRTIPETRAAGADGSVQVPVCGSLRFMGKLSFWQKLWRWNWSKQEEPQRDIQLSFFDSAGEDLVSAESMTAECRYIYSSKGLILLLDPLQIPMLRAELVRAGRLDEARLPKDAPPPYELLERLIEVLRQQLHLKANERIPVPIAVAFSKCDELDSIVQTHHPAWAPTDGRSFSEDFDSPDGRFDWMAHQEVQNAAAKMLMDFGCSDLLQNLRDNFAQYGLFFVSSLGHPPKDGRIEKFAPRRMLDPFLWLLAIHGVIPSAGEPTNPEF